jgi:hypothetical protein
MTGAPRKLEPRGRPVVSLHVLEPVRVMGDITSARLLYVKGALFLVLGLGAGALLIARNPQPATMALLAICVWGFARAYYFLFYVLERYVDRSFRFSGIIAALRYVVRRR